MTKKSILITAIAIGTLAIGGTAYGLNHYKYQQKLESAKQEIQQEEANLKTIRKELDQLSDNKGYLAKGITIQTLNSIKKPSKLNQGFCH